jgi:hypothetical protein
MNNAAGEAERRRKARERKASAGMQEDKVLSSPAWGVILQEDTCPDPEHHGLCPDGSEHDWIKPHPRPRDYKYACGNCGHYDLDDYL